MATKPAEGVCTVRLDGELTIYTAAKQSELLLGKLEQCDELELDLGNVDDIDSAGVQILLVLQHVSDQMQHRLHLVNHSQPVLEVLELLQLETHLGDPKVASANRDAT